MTLGGADTRFALSHLVLRGEFLAGAPGGDTTRGGYVDAYYRLPGVSSVALVGRAEALKPSTHEPAARQMTVVFRYVVSPLWTFSTNYQCNNRATRTALPRPPRPAPAARCCSSSCGVCKRYARSPV